MSLPPVNPNNNNTLPPGRKRAPQEDNTQPVDKRAGWIFAASQSFRIEWPRSSKRPHIEARIPFLLVPPNLGKDENLSDVPFNLRLKQIDASIQSKQHHSAILSCSDLRQRCDDPENRALLDLRVAYCYNAMSQFVLANERCESVLQRAQNEETVAFVNLRRAFALYGLKKYDESLIAYDQAISFFQRQYKSPSILYTLYLEKSRLLYQLNRVEEAKMSYHLAQQIKDQVYPLSKSEADVILRDPNAPELPQTDPFIPVSYETLLDFSKQTEVELPHLCCYPFVQRLDCSNIGLTKAPDISRNIFLYNLNLSSNNIQQPPVLTNNFELATLQASGNELEDFPNLTQNRKLCLLCLAHNRLQGTLDLRENSELGWLDLSNNLLKESPNLSQNRKLYDLNLSENKLDQFPDLTQNGRLTRLDLSGNRLRGTISFAANLKLERIYLRQNRLTEPPVVNKNAELTTLDLSSNALKKGPDVRQNLKLRTLDLSINELTEVPDVSQNTSLTQLILTDNQLTELPDFILILSKTCRIDVTDNRFSEEYIEAFQEKLEKHRREHPGQGPDVVFSIGDSDHSDDSADESVSLSGELQSWSKEFVNRLSSSENTLRKPPDASRLSLNEKNQEVLRKFLKRMRTIPDYEDPETRGNIVLQVENILQLACDQLEFREAMLALMNEGLGRCGDRILIYFNKVEILYQFHHKPLTDLEFKQLAIRAHRFERVEQYGTAVYESRGGSENPTNDEIEIILHFLVELKESLSLPFTTKFMKHREWSKVTAEMIPEAKIKIGALSDAELLQQSDYWLERMKKLFPELWNEIDTTYRALMDEAGDYFELKEEAQAAFLETHQELQKFLTGPDKEKINMKDYNAVMKYLPRKKDEAIASLKN